MSTNVAVVIKTNTKDNTLDILNNRPYLSGNIFKDELKVASFGNHNLSTTRTSFLYKKFIYGTSNT